MIDGLLNRIVTSAALNHPVFAHLAARQHPPEKIAAFLREMGAFCEASRNPGNMPSALRALSLVDIAADAEAIFASEAGHGTDFAALALTLLREHPLAQDDWQAFPVVSHETRAACDCFAARSRTDRVSVAYSLGVMLVVEVAANRQIIPGEVNAFVASGHYGLSLSDVPYLFEHAGEGGAEEWHEEKIIQMIDALPHDLIEDAVKACDSFLMVLEQFYSRLDACLA